MVATVQLPHEWLLLIQARAAAVSGPILQPVSISAPEFALGAIYGGGTHEKGQGLRTDSSQNFLYRFAFERLVKAAGHFENHLDR